jgi:hypothetical protein
MVFFWVLFTLPVDEVLAWRSWRMELPIRWMSYCYLSGSTLLYDNPSRFRFGGDGSRAEL